ncbi:unnamed protein product, partial [marine sediment metagenome]
MFIGNSKDFISLMLTCKFTSKVLLSGYYKIAPNIMFVYDKYSNVENFIYVQWLRLWCDIRNINVKKSFCNIKNINASYRNI